MSRSGPYALLLLAALAFLVSTRPDGWGGALVAVGVEVDGAWLRAASRIALLGGAFLVPLGLLWLVRIERASARWRSYAVAMEGVAQRLGASLASSSEHLSCAMEVAGLGDLKMALSLRGRSSLVLGLAAPARGAVLVRRRAAVALERSWAPVAAGLEWELRSTAPERVGALPRNAALSGALDALYALAIPCAIRHDHAGLRVELADLPAEKVEDAVERSYAVVALLTQLNG